MRPAAMGKALAARIEDDRWSRLEARLICGGKSNLTFELHSPAGELILRRPPTGEVLPRAHDMGREVRVQAALRGSDVPVAEIVWFEPEPGFLDAPFYVMERIPGVVLRDELPAGPEFGSAALGEIACSVADTLARLHALDITELGLEGFGRPHEYAARQIRTWWRQFESAQTRDVPAVVELHRRLLAHNWNPSPRPSLVHGDYRLDNCVVEFAPRPRVCGVLDWELATLGDPLCDLGTLLLYWVEAGETEPLLTPSLTANAGFLTRRQIADRYSRISGRDLDDLDAYIALAHFKLVGIAQGIALRVKRGQTAGEDFGDIDAEIERVAAVGLDALKGAL